MDVTSNREQMLASPDERRYRSLSDFSLLGMQVKSNGREGGGASGSGSGNGAASGRGVGNGRTVARKHFSYINDNEMNGNEEKKTVLYELCSEYLKNDISSIQRSLVTHVEYTLARRRYKFDNRSFYEATAHSLRDRLLERWVDTQQYYASRDVKRVYYLSVEYLVGRSLQNASINLGLGDVYAMALSQLGYDMEKIIDEEKDPGLGNGGLGRLASCFLDSAATNNFPCFGYGIRYKYGMLEQKLVDNYQVEYPDYWLTRGNPWEVERLDVQYPVRFYGRVRTFTNTENVQVYKWEGGDVTMAVAYDTPIPGYKTYNTNNMRLWSSRPSSEFDLESFNKSGNYFSAIEDKERSESITSVLYPNDTTMAGKELRLKQQFFFVSATLQDILRRYKKHKPLTSLNLDMLPSKVAIQINDTHPSIAIPEMMRLLLDEELLTWDQSWDITYRVFSYTNHTVMPEALEKWEVGMMENLLPRHMQIIYELNHRFLQAVSQNYPGDVNRLSRMSIIEEGDPKFVRMGHLAVIGSHTVNGVSEIHSSLVKSSLFRCFHEFWPASFRPKPNFQNKTNGVTPRRWMLIANPSLSAVVTEWLGDDSWVMDLSKMSLLLQYADDKRLHQQWRDSKRENKLRLAEYIKLKCGIHVDVDALFDVHVKRIHEYKRQLLNILSIVHRYISIKAAIVKHKRAEASIVPRVVVFAGKAPPGYKAAKDIIHLICSVADHINSDESIKGLLKVVFIPNYNVSLAELIIPAADLSQHISTAGMEASGTSNMKFAMNGALLIATRDGANVEIAEACESLADQTSSPTPGSTDANNSIFFFGASVTEVMSYRSSLPFRSPPIDSDLKCVLEFLTSSTVFGPTEDHAELLDSIIGRNDHYLVAYDFASYIDAQRKVDELYKNPEKWVKRSVSCASAIGKFSSDRTIKEYARDIWKIKPAEFGTL